MIRKKNKISYSELEIKNVNHCELCSDLEAHIKSMQEAQARAKQDNITIIDLLKRIQGILQN